MLNTPSSKCLDVQSVYIFLRHTRNFRRMTFLALPMLIIGLSRNKTILIWQESNV